MAEHNFYGEGAAPTTELSGDQGTKVSQADFEAFYARMMDCVNRRGLFDSQSALCAMISGGSDSTALAYLLAEARNRGDVGVVTFLHVNHKIRGEAAFGDARFVERLAEALAVPLFLCEVDIPALVQETGGNLEALARSERYKAAREALASMCEHEGFAPEAGLIATAHTADDRIETFYMRSIVGTGPGGFRSIKYANDDIIRPVLDFSREELQEVIYAATSMGKGCDKVDKAADKAVGEAMGASSPSASKELWREDVTNADTDRFRAFVRHEIVPLAKRWNPSLVTTLTRTMNQIADEDDMLEEITDEIVWNRVQPLETQDGHAVQGGGFLCLPVFGEVALPVARRALVALLKHMLGADERIDAASVNAILKAFDPETNRPIGGYVANIQGNLAVSANKLGVRVEPMAAFRARRKKQDSKKQ